MRCVYGYEKLESERDEARAEVEEYKTAFTEMNQALGVEVEEVERLKLELTAVTEQRDRYMVICDEYSQVEIPKLTEQRDKLTEAVTQYLPYVPNMQPVGAARRSDANVKAWALREALQSLTTKDHE
jgi:chromosome segregation ATPase